MYIYRYNIGILRFLVIFLEGFLEDLYIGSVGIGLGVFYGLVGIRFSEIFIFVYRFDFILCLDKYLKRMELFVGV